MLAGVAVIRKETIRIQEKELSDFNALLKSARQWQEASLIREYVIQIENTAVQKSEISDELKAWIEWARRRADSLDPTINFEVHPLSTKQKHNF